MSAIGYAIILSMKYIRLDRKCLHQIESYVPDNTHFVTMLTLVRVAYNAFLDPFSVTKLKHVTDATTPVECLKEVIN